MGNFKQRVGNRFGGNRGGGRGFGNRGGGRPDFRGPVTMHKVICDECKKPCEVPFMPTAGKPVYCNACFGNRKEGGNKPFRNDFGGYKTPPKTDFGNDVNKVTGVEIKKLLESLNSKMEQLLITLTNKEKSISESVKESTIVKVKKPVRRTSKKK